MKKSVMLLFFVIIGMSLVACTSQKSKSTEMYSADNDMNMEAKKLNTLLEEYWDEFIELNPIFATLVGDDRYDDRLSNGLSLDYRGKEIALYNKYLSKVSELNRTHLSGQDKLSYDIFIDLMASNLEGTKIESYLMPINQFSSTPLFFARLGAGASLHPFKTVKNYEDFLGRMNSFHAWVDTAIFYMKEGIDKGVVQPKILIEKAIPQFETQLVDDVTESMFYSPINNFPEDFENEDRVRLTDSYSSAINELVIPAYRKLTVFLKEEYLPKTRESIGMYDMPTGKNWYDYRVKTLTTTDLTPSEIHELGLSEVNRITKEMELIKESVGFKGTLTEFFASLKDDEQHYFTKEEDLLTGYEDIREVIKPGLLRLFNLMPKADFEIRPVEAFRAKTSAGASYMRPAPDGSRPGVFFVNTYDLASRAKFSMESLFLHEAAPGHHFQISLQMEQKELPDFRRFGSYTAYIEGWALYAESLGKEVGLYSDPYQNYGGLAAEMFRAIRLVVDTGMHTKGWTRQESLDFFKDKLGVEGTRAIAETERYLAIPGQALTYKIGQLKIRELRNYSEEKLGDKFDIRAYHDEVLMNGALPLSVLQTRIEEWVAGQM